MKFRTLFGAAVLVVAGAGAASATVAFPKADQNGDGYVTYEEARRVFPGLKRVHFRKCDPSGDGRIDAREYPLLDNFYWVVYKSNQ